ncbi:TonB-dependent receptor [Mangrovibacterium diazotrophicum]|uniref:Iron complex outermembrane receptor protein n=1 Tax=Mangrovibacterium diazotrophicum TaxID=1261403 RepID=A0A419W4M0_9BACT|nr:TonB-dependent receptor plug domain-containing protein [Mangrovibacterium diazotrophicum]RKD90395.1 iron complex outermembrane receptor protein [Mangrovibacterium diazotrophicum]
MRRQQETKKKEMWRVSLTKVFPLLFACLFSNPGFGQSFELRGELRDSITNEVVPFARILLPELNWQVSADAKGNFQLSLPDEGPIHLEIVHTSYHTVLRTVEHGQTDLHVLMVPKNVGIGEVSVVSRAKLSPVKEVTVEPEAWQSSITRISAKEIEQMDADNVWEALKYSVNGMPSEQGRRKKYYYMIRGQNVAADYAINGVSLLTNGAGPMAQWVEAPSMLPANMIESVEVIRSGNSLLLGYSGINGVVNIKTKTFDRFTTSGEIQYGSFNSWRAGVMHGGKVGQLNYVFSLYNDRTDGLAGRHSHENLWNFYGKLNYRLKDKLELDVENFYTYGTRFVTQAVDYQGLVLPEKQLSEIWEYDPMRYNVLTARLKWNASEKASTELQFAYILNRMDLYPDAYQYGVDSETNEAVVGDSIIRAQMLSEPDSILSIGVFQALQLFPKNTLRIAGMYASSANYTHGKAKKDVYAAALLDQHHFKHADVHLGVKLIREYYKYYVPNQGFGDESRAVQNEWQPVLPNLSSGISWHYSPDLNVNLMVNAGVLPLDQTALQLLDDGSTTSLEKEHRTGVDLGLEHFSDGWGNTVFTLFLLRQQNTSDFTNRAYYDDDGQIRYYQKNISLHTYGAELTYHSPEWRDHWSLMTNLSYKLIYQSEESQYRKYAKQPPFIANLGLSYVARKFNANLFGKYVSDYKTDRFLKEEVSIGNYFNWDLNINYRVPGDFVELRGAVRNIFDERYATVSPIYPDFGRQFSIGIRLLFQGASKHEH